MNIPKRHFMKSRWPSLSGAGAWLAAGASAALDWAARAAQRAAAAQGANPALRKGFTGSIRPRIRGARPSIRWRRAVRRLDEVFVVLGDGCLRLLDEVAVGALGLVRDDRMGCGCGRLLGRGGGQGRLGPGRGGGAGRCGQAARGDGPRLVVVPDRDRLVAALQDLDRGSRLERDEAVIGPHHRAVWQRDDVPGLAGAYRQGRDDCSKGKGHPASLTWAIAAKC